MNRTTALRLVALALTVGVVTDILFRGNALGLNVALDTGLLLAAAALAAGPARLRRLDPADSWLAPGALAFAVAIAVRADPVLTLANAAGVAGLGAGFLATLGGARLTRAPLAAVIAHALGVAGAAAGGGVRVLRAARPEPGVATRLRRAPTGAAPVVRGLLLVIPLLAVFAALFAAADAVFAGMANQLLELPFRLPLAAAAEHTAWTAGVAWVAGGLLAVAVGALPIRLGAPAGDGRPGPISGMWVTPGVGAVDVGAADGAAPDASTARGAVGRPDLDVTADNAAASGRVEALVVLVGLDLLFGAFVALQVAYLFGGVDTLAAAGLTYAEYARRGFFELLAAAGLAAVVVVGLEAIVPDASRSRRAAGIALLGLTTIVLVSSFLRLRLYQEAYGWTELRFWVLLSIGWLAASLLAMVVLIGARRPDRMIHSVVLLGIAAVLVADLVAPQRLVAEQNLARALDPSLVTPGGSAALDDGYLGDLSDDAVPVIVAALPRLGAGERANLGGLLARRRENLAEDPALAGWPAWNLARAQAREALATLPGR